MDCNCNCFGIAASSKKPVKRYNLLVPDIFPKASPPYQERLDISTERKLKKLFEYLEKNLNRGPKASLSYALLALLSGCAEQHARKPRCLTSSPKHTSLPQTFHCKTIDLVRTDVRERIFGSFPYHILWHPNACFIRL